MARTVPSTDRPPGRPVARIATPTCVPRVGPNECSARSTSSSARSSGNAESLARQFDRVLQLLEGLGVPRRLEAHRTRRASSCRIFHESDLLITEALSTGAARRSRCRVARRAGLVLHLRTPVQQPAPEPWFPGPDASPDRFEQLERAGRSSSTPTRSGSGSQPTRHPDPGFFAIAHAWVAGEELDEILADEEFSGGDFVRNMKQLLDLLRQIGDAADDPTTARTARAAADALVPRSGVGFVRGSPGHAVGNEGEGSRRRRGRGHSVTIERGAAWGTPGRLPPERRRGAQRRRGARASSSRAGGPASRVPTLGLFGGDLCRTLGRHRRRERAAVRRRHDLPDRRRRRAGRRSPALVRRPSRSLGVRGGVAGSWP